MDIPNLWGDFKDLEVNTPNQILEQQAKFLPKLTGDIVYAEIIPLELPEQFEISSDFDNDLSFKFVLKSKFMDNYQFEMFKYSHDIIIYPTTILLDRETKEELGLSDKFEVVGSEQEFIDFLSKVFKTERIKRVIGALMKLSK